MSEKDKSLVSNVEDGLELDEKILEDVAGGVPIGREIVAEMRGKKVKIGVKKSVGDVFYETEGTIAIPVSDPKEWN